jgi:integrase
VKFTEEQKMATVREHLEKFHSEMSKCHTAAMDKGAEPEFHKAAAAVHEESWLRCFLGLGFNFGMRKGELLAMRVRDVGLKEELLGSRIPDVNLLDDLLDGWLTVPDSKNGDSRKIPLTQETKTLLGECIRGKEKDDFILTRRDGQRVAQPRKDWYSLCCRCALGEMITEKLADGKTSVRYAGFQMHDLRRSAVRRMIRSGISQTVAMRISGHKTASVFRRYDITDECDLEQAAKLLEPNQVSVSEVENRHQTVTTGFARA